MTDLIDLAGLTLLSSFPTGAVMTMLKVLTSADELEAAILLSGYLPLPNQTQQVSLDLLPLTRISLHVS